jgi:DNA polymerase III subunit delta
MQVRSSQLPSALKNKLSSLYLLCGEDPFLVQHHANMIVDSAKLKQFNEKISFYHNASFEWKTFEAQFSNFSLFEEKKIITLFYPSAKIDKKTSQQLTRIISLLTEDHCLIIQMPKLSSASKRSQWYKSIDNIGSIIHLWPPSPAESIKLLHQHAQKHQISIAQDAIEYIMNSSQNNFLSATQSIEKLSIQFQPNSLVNFSDITQTLTQQSKYNVFDLNRMFLLKNHSEALVILRTLKEDHYEPNLILWSLMQNLRLLQQCQSAYLQNESTTSIFKHSYFPKNQQTLIMNASKSFSTQEIKRYFVHALIIDKSIKGFNPLDSWLLLERMVSNKT